MFEMFDDERIKRRRILSRAIVAIVVGILMVVIPYDVLINMLFFVIVLMIIFSNILPCLAYWSAYSNDKRYLSMAIISTVSVVIGFLFMFWHDTVISIILAIWLIIMPIIRIVLSQNKKEQLKSEIPLFIIAVFLFFVPASTIFKYVILVFGGILIIFGLASIILLLLNKNNNSNGSNKPKDDKVIIDAKIKDL